MKKLLILALLVLTGCDQGASNNSSGTSTSTPNDITNIVAPIATPTCADFNGTKWVISGSPTLTAASQDQSGQAPYIAAFDLRGNAPTFTEKQYVSGFGTLSCTRNFDDGVAYNGDVQDLVWSVNVTSGCQSVAGRIQFDTSACNVLTVSILDGSGSLYETISYIPQ